MVEDIDYTAVRCAAARAFYSEIPYTKEIFEEIKPEYAKTRGKLGVVSGLAMKLSSATGGVCILEGRYYSTNDAINKRLGKDIPVLEMASGLSPRGLHLAGEYTVYMETDRKETIRRKKEVTENVLKKRGRNIPDNHLFQELDMFDYDDFEKAGETIRKVDPYGPIAVIHEGVFMYFNEEEQEMARDNIKRFLEDYGEGGAWITPDFSYKKDRSGSMITRLVRFFIRKRLERFSGSKLSYFEEENVMDFLKHAGMKAEILPNRHIAKTLSCIEKAGIGVEESIDMADMYKTWFITLDD